jgi:hypothetical protein
VAVRIDHGAEEVGAGDVRNGQSRAPDVGGGLVAGRGVDGGDGGRLAVGGSGHDHVRVLVES